MALVVMPPVLLISHFWHQTKHLVKPDFVSLEQKKVPCLVSELFSPRLSRHRGPPADQVQNELVGWGVGGSGWGGVLLCHGLLPLLHC